MRILVTGGAGFIGSHTVDALIASGATEVSVLDNFSTGKRHQVNPKATCIRPICVMQPQSRQLSKRCGPKLFSISRRRWTCGVRSPILRSTRR